MSYQELIDSPILPSQVIKLARKTAQNIASIMIYGEQGTGKELTARIIHHLGNSKQGRFYRYDCQLLTEEALNINLSRLFEETRNGSVPLTLFLKEIGFLSVINQIKLMELMEGNTTLNGSGKETAKIRIISSSSEDLGKKVTQGKYSRDLYFNLNTLSIHLPPLRERVGEIPSIVNFILEKNIKKMNIRRVSVSSEAIRLLESYGWPGNLKELEQVLMQSAILSEGKQIMEKDLFFEHEIGKNAFVSFLEKREGRPSRAPQHNADPSKFHVSSAFFIELVHRIKNPLVSVKTFTQLLRDKFNDPEFREYFYRIVTEDIEKIDFVLNGLLGYVKINHPIEKRDTVHSIIEDVLKKQGPQIESKRIKILKKFEAGLPETIVHEEQLKYILDSLVLYALPSIPFNGSIGFLTKSAREQRIEGEERTRPGRERKHIEILMIFTGFKKHIESMGELLGIPGQHEKEINDLEIRLIEEMIQKNRGKIKYEVNEKKLRTLISLQFPVERRTLIYYQSRTNE